MFNYTFYGFQDLWRGFNTRYAYMVHIVDSIRYYKGVYILREVSLCIKSHVSVLLGKYNGRRGRNIDMILKWTKSNRFFRSLLSLKQF